MCKEDALWHTEWSGGQPPQQLSAQCIDVRQLIAVTKGGQPVVPDYGVDFRLSFALGFRVECHSEEE